MIHSLSKLGTFEQCGAKYKYQYIDRLPRPTNASAQRGVDTHAMVELFVKGELDELPAHLDFYSGFLRGLRSIAGVEPEAKLALSETWECRDWDAPEIWWRGVLDLLIPPQSGTVHVYDWKTGKIYDDHEDQRQIYALAAIAKYPDAHEVKATHVYLDLQKNVTQTYHRDQMQALRDTWTRRFKALELASEFPHNPQFKCRWCPFSKVNGGPCPF